MRKLILIALLLVAFITFSFRMIGNKKGESKNNASNEQVSQQGFASSDPVK